MEKGKLFVISAPSGTGKSTIIRSVLEFYKDEMVYSVSATTRSPRNNEVHGKDYFFISEEEFLSRIDNDEFLEWEKVYDYYYGTMKCYVEEAVDAGKHVMLELDVNGAVAVKNIYIDAILIYILPPDIDELVKRLKNRKTETESDFRKRIERAKMELSMKDNFDYFVLNEDLTKAVEDTKSLLKKIIKKEKD